MKCKKRRLCWKQIKHDKQACLTLPLQLHRGQRGGGMRQQLWFPSISFLGGLPGQMGRHDVTCVKRECLYPTVSSLCLALASRINPHLRWEIWPECKEQHLIENQPRPHLQHPAQREEQSLFLDRTRVWRDHSENSFHHRRTARIRKNKEVRDFRAHSWFRQEIRADLQSTRNFNLDTAWLKSLGPIIMEKLRISRTSSRGGDGKN